MTARGNYIWEHYALRFISGLRATKMIKEQVQLQSQMLIFSQCTYYGNNLWDVHVIDKLQVARVMKNKHRGVSRGVYVS